MGADSLNPILGSTLHDKVHKGSGQAGFKSNLSYRVDLGIPGYTGYVPGCTAIPVNIKGATVHTGKIGDEELRQAVLHAHKDTHQTTMYGKHYQAEVSNYEVPRKEGGGYWFSQRQLTQKLPLASQTTYKADIQKSAETSQKLLGAVDGLQCTIAYSEQARRSKSAGALGLSGRRTSSGDQIGYATEYQSMVLSDPLTGGSAAPGNLRSHSAPSSDLPTYNRRKILPRAMAPHLSEITSYHTDYGEYKCDPLSRSARTKELMTSTCTTKDLAQGTTRNVTHIPGYSGFIPATHHNKLANKQSLGTECRRDAKIDMLLYNNDNHLRERVPGYTGFKPQAASNVTSIQPSNGPNKQTCYGWNNYEVCRRPIELHDNTMFINSRQGLLSFFTSGGAFVSENGVTESQKYYDVIRPMEGLPKINRPSQRTYYGSTFANSAC